MSGNVDNGDAERNLTRNQKGGRVTRKCGREACRPCNLPSCKECKTCIQYGGKKRCEMRKCGVYDDQLLKRAEKRGDLVCPKCGTTFTRKGNKTSHMKKASCGKIATVYGVLPTQCLGCKLFFPNKPKYDLHAIEFKNKNEPGHSKHQYQCMDCWNSIQEEKYYMPAAMTRHAQWHRNLQKPSTSE